MVKKCFFWKAYVSRTPFLLFVFMRTAARVFSVRVLFSVFRAAGAACGAANTFSTAFFRFDNVESRAADNQYDCRDCNNFT